MEKKEDIEKTVVIEEKGIDEPKTEVVFFLFLPFFFFFFFFNSHEKCVSFLKVISFTLKAPKKNVQWTEDVVDNEFMGKRSSKSFHFFFFFF